MEWHRVYATTNRDSTPKENAMKTTILLGSLLMLIALLSACSVFRAENPLNIDCPSCGYQWDRTIPR